MATEDLVQDNTPYGERQARVVQMRQAGIPTETTAQPGAVPPSPPRVSGAAPAEVDALRMLEPSPPGELPPMMSEADRLRTLAASTPNSVLSIVLSRVADQL